MTALRSGWLSGLLGTLVVAISGCTGTSDQPELAAVEGIVTLDGKPLSGAQVLFAPEKGRGSFGVTDDEGHYTLSYTFEVAGAMLGPHKVAISTPLEDESDPEARNFVDPIPPKYNKQTTLTAEVKAEEDNVINFPLESK